ncbi:MAG TPA: GAF domain-containing protein [Spirillospora sp.]|nr:GAF domain-containing protein [Spirillospora sp.]
MTESTSLHETDILYAASNRLTQASTPEELLDAITGYARDCSAVSALLFYVIDKHPDEPVSLTAMAQWGQPGYELAVVGERIGIDELGMRPLYETHHERPIFIEDTRGIDFLPPPARSIYTRAQISSAVILLLTNKSRWIGGVGINWAEPRQFDERDRRIYTALSQLAAPIIDSIRLIDQTRQRAAELEAAKNEIDLLYTAANRLVLAQTPAEQLEAVSDYALGRGATQGILFMIDSTSGDPPESLEVAAEWVLDPRQEAGVGNYYQTLGLPFSRFIMTYPLQPILLEDLENEPLVDPVIGELFRQHAQRGAAILPLYVKDRWIGLLWFTWNVPYAFDEHDRQIYTALLRQAAPVIGSVRLLEQTQRRAEELEATNHEIAMLYRASGQLARATTPAGLLEAISAYPYLMGATTGILVYNYPAEGDTPGWGEIVATWVAPGGVQYELGTRYSDDRYTVIGDWINNHDQPWLIDDPRQELLDAASMQRFTEGRSASVAILPLHNQSRVVGAVFFSWITPYRFSERDQRIYTALIQQAAPAIDSVRLLEDNRARAQRAEEAYRESDTLYRAGRAINAATTFDEIVRAIEALDPDANGIALSLWEGYDYQRANYFEVVAVGKQEPPTRVGTRYRVEQFPITAIMPHDQPTFLEDIDNDPRVDPVSRESWQRRGVRAAVAVPLTLNNRWMGTLAFHSHYVRSYTQLEQRLVAGIGDLVTAAIERIRLQTTTEASRRRAETLAHISAALSQATTEQDILAAIEPLAQRFGVALAVLAYANSNEHGQIVEVRTVALRAPQAGPIAVQDFPVSAFGLSDFPFLRLAYEKPDAPIFIDNVHTHLHDAAAPADWPAVIALPLKTGDIWQGVLMFLWAEPQIFDPEIRRMVTALQPPLAAIVATRRAYMAERQRARELETVAQVSAAVSSVLDIHDLLDTVAEVTRLSFTDYRCFIYLLDESGTELVAATNEVPAAPVACRIPLASERSLIAQAGRSRTGMIVNDITSAHEYDLAPLLSQAHSEMAVPMVVGNRLIGVLDIQAREANRFSEADIRVMGTLADLIAVAMQNARLYAQAQEVAALEERNRLARELHDSVSQALYGIALGARTARTLLERDPEKLREPLDYVLSLADAGLTEMRALIFELRPESLENEGLIAALTKQAASIQARHGIIVENHLCEEPDVPLELKEALYRISREALHNMVKHAQATRATLDLRCNQNEVILEIDDDGAGFDASASFPGHLGLKSMRERATRLNGTCEIVSAPQQGTHIVVRLPRPV